MQGHCLLSPYYSKGGACNPVLANLMLIPQAKIIKLEVNNQAKLVKLSPITFIGTIGKNLILLPQVLLSSGLVVGTSGGHQENEVVEKIR